MKGKVFEKVGVNVSTVGGRFSPEFAATIHGAEEDPRFFATGISLVAHMANPHVPAVHMNTRFLTTTRRWFGGGADLNPPIPYEEDTDAFHARLRAACAAHDPTFYPRFSQMGGGVFLHPPPRRRARRRRHLLRPSRRPFRRAFRLHPRRRRGVPRHLPEARPAADGHAVRPRPTGQRQLEWRGRYVEFNLLYDRGTLFGLKTGGNVDAILMSLPPLARWA